jgi:hypothetical protein
MQFLKEDLWRPFQDIIFLIIEIVGFDNFKCIPCSCVPHNNRIFLAYLANAPKHEEIH